MKRNDKVKGILNYNGISGDSLNYVTMVGATSTGKIFYTSGGTEYEAELGDLTPNPILVSIVITGATSVITGTTANYVATGTYTDSSTEVITTAVTWTRVNTLANSTIVTGTGELTAGTLTGSTILTATITNVASEVITANYNVSITY